MLVSYVLLFPRVDYIAQIIIVVVYLLYDNAYTIRLVKPVNVIAYSHLYFSFPPSTHMQSH